MLTFKKATIEDCNLIHQLAHQVFPVTYQDILTSQQIIYMMEWMYSLESIQEQIQKEHIYFIAYENEIPCGYLSIEQQERDLFHLQKIYVLPDFQGKRYGKKLFNKAIEYIKSVHPTPCTMELNVNRYNKAVGFYERLGMQKVREGDFPIGNGFLMEDYIMAINL